MADETHVGRRTALLACCAALLVAAIAPAAVHSADGSRTTATALESGVLAELNGIRAEPRPAAAQVQRPPHRRGAPAHLRDARRRLLRARVRRRPAVLGRVAQFYPQGKGIWLVGENLLWASPTLGAATAVESWMGSPGHRKNMLRRAWREIGIAAVQSSTSTGEYGGAAVTVITADFGVR